MYEFRQPNTFVNWIAIYDSMFSFSTIMYNVFLVKEGIAQCAET